MLSGPRLQTFLLTGGTVLVAGLTLGPALWPQTRVPVVSRVALPAVVASPVSNEPPTYPTTSSVSPLISGRLNLNTATLEQLEALPKVGPALAQRLIEHRPYHSLADLDAVKGVGESTLKTLAPLVTY